MSDFFVTLELQLREAAEPGPRRRPAWAPAARGLVVAALTLALLALAVVPALVLLGDGNDPADEPASVPAVAPVGTVIPKGEGTPRRVETRTVVATGEAPVAGLWQMETYGSTRLADPETGEVYQPSGLRCLGLVLLDPPWALGPTGGGQCGEFPRTPGFGRVQHTVLDSSGEAREILVYGRVPEEASSVVITVDGRRGSATQVEPFEGPPGAEGDFYLIPIPAEWDTGRVNWLDEHGNEGSRGHELMPR
ncbi:MAG TPA: hypothetical protein VE270_10230 [Thermoleophilaceae bacterium]|nr:hypothetical protein [Thermoleophilaceae bacterium]